MVSLLSGESALKQINMQTITQMRATILSTINKVSTQVNHVNRCSAKTSLFESCKKRSHNARLFMITINDGKIIQENNAKILLDLIR